MKPLNLFLIIIPAILIAMPTALADQICVDNSTIQDSFVTKVGSQSAQNITINETCDFGCDEENNRCNPSPFDTLIIYVIGGIVGVLILVGFLLWIARK